MKAIILAAGLGKRMMPLTADKPKPMVEVLGKPIIGRLIESLPDVIDEVVVITGYRGEMIREYLGTEYAGRAMYYEEQKELNGHIPALALARHLLKPGERFLILPADDIRGKEDLTRLISHPLAVGVHEVEHPERFGIVVPSEKNTIADIEEKPAHPKSNLATTMAYVLDDSIFEYQPKAHGDGEYYLPPVVVQIAQKRDIFIERENDWVAIGYPEDIARAEAILIGRATAVE